MTMLLLYRYAVDGSVVVVNRDKWIGKNIYPPSLFYHWLSLRNAFHVFMMLEYKIGGCWHQLPSHSLYMHWSVTDCCGLSAVCACTQTHACARSIQIYTATWHCIVYIRWTNIHLKSKKRRNVWVYSIQLLNVSLLCIQSVVQILFIYYTKRWMAQTERQYVCSQHFTLRFQWSHITMTQTNSEWNGTTVRVQFVHFTLWNSNKFSGTGGLSFTSSLDRLWIDSCLCVYIICFPSIDFVSNIENKLVFQRLVVFSFVRDYQLAK